MDNQRILSGYWRWVVFTCVGFILWAGIIAALESSFNQQLDSILQTELEGFSAKIAATLRTYERFSQYVFQRVISRPEILVAMYQASQSTDEQKDQIRQSLYRSLIGEYELIQEYDFRQLHFHLANGDSFLRMHAPQQFGDNLLAVRDSIRIANVDQEYVFGFEEGRIFNGYRFVYPLFYQESHVGSVEVSLSMASLVSVLHHLYPEIDVCFAVDKTVVESLVFEDQQDRYLAHPSLPGFALDIGVLDAMSQSTCADGEAVRSAVVGQIVAERSELLERRRSFAQLVDYQGKRYLVQFMAVKNISGVPIAYLSSLEEPTELLGLHQNLHRDQGLVSGIFLLWFITTFVLTRQKLRLEELSAIDQLTKTFNRRRFLTLAERELERSRRNGHATSVVLLDIDHFKQINDTYGHNCGDHVLEELAVVLSSALRSQDTLARWGGEEFIVLLPETPATKAEKLAERLRHTVESHVFFRVERVTISLGVAEHSETMTLEELVVAADQAMYAAKNAGRNRVCS